MADEGDSGTESELRRTRWDIRRDVGGSAQFMSPKGRFFSVGDRLNLPPPLPRGSVWIVTAVEPPETDGYDGTLVLEPAVPLPDPIQEPLGEAVRDDDGSPA
jgi:hypothetical protein